ncbi:type IV pilus twitching motility protein PilT [Armatimonas sp.]|uniref:type IV pilus twitching motility protein PilT n=1 Tax=Armatimonas sp. TaxID=1872638 RepID=UPI00375371BB
MNSLLPDDDLAPLPQGGGNRTATPSALPALDSTQMLRGLLEDGALLMPPGMSNQSPLGNDSFEEVRSAPSVTPLGDTHLDDILHYSQQMKASDIHLTVNLPPMVRVDGKLIPTPWEVVTPREVQRLVYDILLSDQIERYERTKELDFSYGVHGVGRFRFNVYRQRGSVGCAMRAIPAKIPSLDSLRMPPILKELTKKHSGVILVTGPTGSGKSTTIASMIDVINAERPVHILTMEDPIEYIHSHKVAMVNQREIGHDSQTFANAIRAALREDPDVILVGELRDKETIAAALTLAETGHLVFGTLHTRSAPATVDRIIDVFPSDQQDQIRVQFAGSLQAVVAQQLLPMVGGGRVAAIEIMVATSAVRNLIREGKSHQLLSSIETGGQIGMQQMDKVLAELHRSGMVTMEEALSRSNDRDSFLRHLKGGS